MSDNRKAMNVSYRGFSCSLEGFDDPFTTMCSIVEYLSSLTDDNMRSLKKAQYSRLSDYMDDDLGGSEIRQIEAGVENGHFNFRKKAFPPQERPMKSPTDLGAAWVPAPLNDPGSENVPGSEVVFGTVNRDSSKTLNKLQKARERIASLHKGEDEGLAPAPEHYAPASQKERGDVSSCEVDEDLDRLMNEAEHHIYAPENKRRQATYANLRAAVARARDVVSAKREKPVGSEAELGDDFIETSPLLLLPEQRVPPRKNIRPGFERSHNHLVALVDTLDAKKMVDILEVAAAYIIGNKGRENFTFADLVDELEYSGYDFPRDSLMRSFGFLVYEKRILRSGAGDCFTLSENLEILDYVRNAS